MSRSHPSEDGHLFDGRFARELIAGGPSQVERARAMRVRDINRPTEQDLAEAESTVRVVRRNWKPRK